MKNLIVLLTLFISSLSFASYDLHITENFEDIIDITTDITDNHSPEDVLIVFDIDHTLLLIDDCIPKQDKSTKKGKGRKESFGAFIQKVKQCGAYLTSPLIPDFIYNLQDNNYSVMAFTARGKNLTDPTLEQLQERLRYSKEESDQAKISFPTAPAYDTQKTPHPGYKVNSKKGIYTKYVTYKEGVALVGGADKGRALQGFLIDIDHNYKQIIFIDDNQRNITNLENAYRKSSEHMTIIHYTEFDRKKKK